MPRNVNPPSANALTITIAGAAAANAKTVGHMIDGAPCQYTTTLGQSAADAAALLKTAIEAALPTYSVSIDGAVVTVASPTGGAVTGWPYGNDTTQLITSTGGNANALVLSSSTATGGKPSSGGVAAGYAIDSAYTTRDAGAATIVVTAVLRNASGAAATAAWRLWWWSPVAGWQVDGSVSGRTISDAGSSTALATVDQVAVAGYGSRVAVELIGKTTSGTNLDAGETLLVWVEVI